MSNHLRQSAQELLQWIEEGEVVNENTSLIMHANAWAEESEGMRACGGKRDTVLAIIIVAIHLMENGWYPVAKERIGSNLLSNTSDGLPATSGCLDADEWNEMVWIAEHGRP